AAARSSSDTRARRRGHRREAPRPALSVGAMRRLGQGEPGRASSDAHYAVTRLRNQMRELANKQDLQRLVDDDIQESLTLEYKAAAALSKDNDPRNELCKDVSAFANSAGGQIIYGIEERGHHPVRVQEADAVDASQISREW